MSEKLIKTKRLAGPKRAAEFIGVLDVPRGKKKVTHVT